MADLISFLTSEESMIVYMVIGVSFMLCLMIYFVEKNTTKRRMRHNTRELNKLVEKIKEEVPVEVVETDCSEPVLEMIIEEENADSNPIIIEETQEEIENVEATPLVEEKLEYTTIEPDRETAQMELKKLTEELKKEESIEDTQNISLTNYEEQQEENAIISLEELVKKSREMYQVNEVTQYADEGNEPISLAELAEKVGMKVEPSYEEPFIIANVVPKEEQIENTDVEQDIVTAVPTQTVSSQVFHNSPIISPIYGIERGIDHSNELALENTANYEKLDAEIKRTNELLMSLKELQNESK